MRIRENKVENWELRPAFELQANQIGSVRQAQAREFIYNKSAETCKRLRSFAVPSDSMSGLRIVNWTNHDEFVKATSGYDDSWMNFAIGALLDSLDPGQVKSQARWGPAERTLVGLYRGDQLLMTLTKIAKDFSWVLSRPLGAVIDPTEASTICDALAQSLPAILSTSTPPSAPDLLKLDKLIGPRTLVDDFLTSWSNHVTSLNIPKPEHPDTPLKLELLDPPYFYSEVSYATLDTIPPASSQFSSEKYSILNPADEEEAARLAPLYVEFTAHSPSHATLEEAILVMKDAIKGRRLWYCLYNELLENEHSNPNPSSEIAGYVMVGRETPRTIAIRNVFVSSSHRRKGIAEALVRAVTRYYLGAEPLDLAVNDVVLDKKTKKEEICLNVADESARRLYIRCGFLLEDGARDPKSGREGSYASIWRGLKVVEPGVEKVVE
ncbi:hypothetical protein QCA50_003579 [Cerrena zonata]|uniref:N-acetyltransferase domain-containing protein n=1 Tax=Cerrena zonata TaxID=2478898 RepID=A0AAW0GK75_9APHY